MQRGFTKLFNTIVTSTIWQEDDKTRIVWITMLAIADADGIVSASIPGLASVANVAVDAARTAVKTLLAEDPDSRTKDFKGRRIEEIDGGWRILNYLKYRRMLNEEERKEYKAKWIAEKRRQMSTSCRPKSTLSTHAEAEAEADAESRVQKKKEKTLVNVSTSNGSFLESLSKNPAYKGINIQTEVGKMQAWCEANHKEPTQRRFVNWLNRADKTISSGTHPTQRLMSAFEIEKRVSACNDKINELWKKAGGRTTEEIETVKKRRNELKAMLSA